MGRMAHLTHRPLLGSARIPICNCRSKDLQMDSWYVSLVPASLALAIIGYSFFVAYA
jgi:hypothetical protein